MNLYHFHLEENIELCKFSKISELKCCLFYGTIPDSSVGKESTCNGGDLGSIPGLGRSPGEGKGYPLQYFLPGEFHGQRLVGYSPWGRKE